MNRPAGAWLAVAAPLATAWMLRDAFAPGLWATVDGVGGVAAAAAGLAAALVALASLRRGARRALLAGALSFAVGWPALALALVAANALPDTSAPVTQMARVTGRAPRLSRARHWLEVASPDGQLRRVYVSDVVYRAAPNQVALGVRAGRLGFPWVASVDLAPDGQPLP